MPKRQLLLLRTGGVQGPFYQNVGGGVLVKTVGAAQGVNGPLSSLKILAGWTGNLGCAE